MGWGVGVVCVWGGWGGWGWGGVGGGAAHRSLGLACCLLHQGSGLSVQPRTRLPMVDSLPLAAAPRRAAWLASLSSTARPSKNFPTAVAPCPAAEPGRAAPAGRPQRPRHPLHPGSRAAGRRPCRRLLPARRLHRPGWVPGGGVRACVCGGGGGESRVRPGGLRDRQISGGRAATLPGCRLRWQADPGFDATHGTGDASPSLPSPPQRTCPPPPFLCSRAAGGGRAGVRAGRQRGVGRRLAAVHAAEVVSTACTAWPAQHG